MALLERSTDGSEKVRPTPEISEVAIRSGVDPYSISPLGLGFRHREEETKYQGFVLNTTVGLIRFALIVGLAIMIVWGLLDPYVYLDPASLRLARLIRYGWMCPILAVLVLTTFASRYVQISQLTGVILSSAFAVGWSVLTYGTNIIVIVAAFPAVVMTTCYVFFFCGIFFRYAFVGGAFINAVFFPAVLSVYAPAGMALITIASMITIFLLLTMAAYQKELLSRQLYVSELRERQKDGRYLQWLRQLAGFLRHEVRQPVAQINSSIEIAQLASKADERLASHLDSAASGTQHVWNLIERASRATDAEAFVRQWRPQPIDLARLLAEQIDASQRVSSGIEFRLQSPATARVRADPSLIKEAIGNLLSNAASFAHGDQPVQVLLELDDRVATIRVANKGPLIDGDTERLFGAFESTRAGPSSEHQGLGLYLVRLIAEQHGGAARIANLPDGSGVQASMLLPLAG
jgi:signal transduction histidine kinase